MLSANNEIRSTNKIYETKIVSGASFRRTALKPRNLFLMSLGTTYYFKTWDLF